LKPGLAENALLLLQSPQPPALETSLTTLLNELATFPEPFTLVLDDYHVIENPALQQSITFLLDHLPPQLHLIIAGRSDPPLPLARLRGRGQLNEVRAADLRFTPQEVSLFLNQVMGLSLSVQQVEALETRTEGWIAGLQLAALAMQNQTDLNSFVNAFTGSNRFVVDYLAAEVFASQPAHIQTFLLQTSILERMCGSLCDAVTGITEAHSGEPNKKLSSDAYSQFLLEELERANLFIIPLDNERNWYRYHHLFAEVMRARLASGVLAETIAILHHRASLWYERQGLTIEAVDHALAAGDFEYAASLIEPIGMGVMLPGQIHTLLGWLKLLPETLLQTQPALSLIYAAALHLDNQIEAVEARLQTAEQWVRPDTPPDQARLILGQAAAVRSNLVRTSGDPARGVILARQALELLPEGQFMRVIAQLNATYAFLVDGDVTPVSEQLSIDLIGVLRASGSLFTLLRGLAVLARLQTVQGRLHQAYATYQEWLQVAPGLDPSQFGGGSIAYLAGLGDLRREWNDLAGAEHHLAQILEMIQGTLAFDAYMVMLGCIALARLQQSQGLKAEAQATLEKFTQLARQRRFFAPLLAQVAAAQAQLSLAQGDLPAAVRWADLSGLHYQDNVSYFHEREYLTLARILIARASVQAVISSEHPSTSQKLGSIPEARTGPAKNYLDEALSLLDRLLAAAETGGRMGSVIEILNLQALALQAQGETAGALTALARSLSLAEPEGYIRLFVDEGASMAKLLRKLSILPEGKKLKSYIETLLAVFGEAKEGGREIASSLPLVSSVLNASPLVEPLSSRELELLQLVSMGRSNQEIAQELFVAIGTVKKHLNNIFGKLGVSNRTQAVARARELKLL
jgi:LuxR family maltose regulon positive regulatory protein